MAWKARVRSSDGVSIVVILGVVVVLAMLIGTLTPFILGHQREQRRVAMVELCSRPMSGILDAEVKIKKETGKFWRPTGTQTLSPADATKELGVDLSVAAGCTYQIYPPDLAADPMVQIVGKGSGEFPDLVVECAFDAPGNTRHCGEAKSSDGKIF